MVTLGLLRQAASELESGGVTSTFKLVEFPTPFPANSNVIVIPMVETFNGSATLVSGLQT